MPWPHNQAVAASWEMKFLTSREEQSPTCSFAALDPQWRHSRSWGHKNTGLGPHRLGRPGTELGVCWHKRQCVPQACWVLPVSLWYFFVVLPQDLNKQNWRKSHHLTKEGGFCSPLLKLFPWDWWLRYLVQSDTAVWWLSTKLLLRLKADSTVP